MVMIYTTKLQHPNVEKKLVALVAAGEGGGGECSARIPRHMRLLASSVMERPLWYRARQVARQAASWLDSRGRHDVRRIRRSFQC